MRWLSLLLLPLASCGADALQPPADPRSESLKALASKADLSIGTEVWWEPLNTDAAYRRILENEFDTMIPGDFFRWDRIYPSEGTFDFSQLDHLALIGQEAAIDLWLGHLVWHPVEWLPQWFALELAEQRAGRQFERPLSDQNRLEVATILRTLIPTPEEEARALSIFDEFITRVVTRYQGHAVAWNVVNESVSEEPDQGLLRDTFWRRLLGPEYIARAFHMARAADPAAKLVLNDYDNEGLGPKSDRFYALVAQLLADGVPVDVVGLQMHVEVGGYPTAEEVRANIRRLSDLGVEVWITEMDVRLPLPVSERLLEQQGERYKEMLSLCVSERACTRFVVWGFTDRHSWIPGHFPGFGAALPFDHDYKAKPAYYALKEALTDS